MSELETPMPTEKTVRIGKRDLSLPEAHAAVRRGGNWFYWIAGLSLANSLAAVFGLGYSMIVGLGITQFADALGRNLAEQDPTARVVAVVLPLVFSVVTAGVYVLFGFHARKFRMWPFYVGLPLYCLDALIFAFVKDWFALAFHVYVLFALYGGAVATKRLRKAEAEQAAAADPATAVAPVVE